MADIFQDLDPLSEEKEGWPLRAVLAERLEKAAKQLEGEAVGDPLDLAELQNQLGHALLGLGGSETAVALFEKALATRKAKLGADDPDTLASMNNLAGAYKAAGKLEKALPLFETTLQRRR